VSGAELAGNAEESMNAPLGWGGQMRCGGVGL
jgi:hypothetical protein